VELKFGQSGRFIVGCVEVFRGLKCENTVLFREGSPTFEEP